MPALADLTEEEAFLFAVLTDDTGVDLAEFDWIDATTAHGRFRLHDYQWPYATCTDTYQADLSGRAVGKTMTVVMRAAAFPFSFPQQAMLLTAPEQNHMQPLTAAVEAKLTESWLLRQMRPGQGTGKTDGITRQPHWECRFVNGARITSRLGSYNGRSVKGQHAIRIETDECFPAGTLVLTRRGLVDIVDVRVGDEVWTHRCRWRAVTATHDRGVRDAVALRGQGHPGLVVTPRHGFWARSRADGAVRWVPAQELAGGFSWATPVLDEKDDVDIRLPRSATGTSYAIDCGTEEFAWALGLFLAEGSLSSSEGRGGGLNRVYWSVHIDEADEVVTRLRAAGLNSRVFSVHGSASCVNVLVTHKPLAAFLAGHVGRGARNKRVPAWVFTAPRAYREQVLDGLVFGDGCVDSDVRYQGRWKLSTSSKGLAVAARLLGVSLGLHMSMYWVAGRDGATIRGREVRSGGWYQVVGSVAGHARRVGDHSFTLVKGSTPAGHHRMYDLSVAEDSSFVADGVVVHNSQDYSPGAWAETSPTLNRWQPGAAWRVHGVPNGPRDQLYDITMTPNNGWTVHRMYAMLRPTWGDAERTAMLNDYGGSRASNSYRRNVLGEHGSSASALFVAARLVRCMDLTAGSVYNADVYSHQRIEYEHLRGAPAVGVLDLPGAHRRGWEKAPKGYSSYHGGMDVGVTNDPSEILVFGQRAGVSDERLDLLLRVHLERIPVDDQEAVVARLFAWYPGLSTFGVDSTGVGFSLAQRLKTRFGDRVQPFNFSSKHVVGFADRELLPGEKDSDLYLSRNPIDYASDELRALVDAGAVLLPDDGELLRQWQGQQVEVVRGSSDAYGRRYSKGAVHTLDAAKLMVAAKRLAPIQAMLAAAAPPPAPVYDRFVGA